MWWLSKAYNTNLGYFLQKILHSDSGFNAAYPQSVEAQLVSRDSEFLYSYEVPHVGNKVNRRALESGLMPGMKILGIDDRGMTSGGIWSCQVCQDCDCSKPLKVKVLQQEGESCIVDIPTSATSLQPKRLK